MAKVIISQIEDLGGNSRIFNEGGNPTLIILMQ